MAKGVRAGDKASVSRALNLIENRRADVAQRVGQLLARLHESDTPAHQVGHPAGHRVGLTGPPGVGKSSLVAVLARQLRTEGKTVGVVAVDPSSVQSGGALLGDRARMGFDPSDEGLFVRSLATAGAFGGLAHAAHAAVEVLAAAFDWVLIETTGVGQTETEVTQVADTVALVVQPGSGDVLQFLKAGVMEIPDLLVVNKADHGTTATRAASDLKAALGQLQTVGAEGGDRPVLLTSARDNRGIAELSAELEALRQRLGPEVVAERRAAGRASWAMGTFLRRFGTFAVEQLGGEAAVRRQVGEALSAGAQPVDVAEQLGARFLAAMGQ